MHRVHVRGCQRLARNAVWKCWQTIPFHFVCCTRVLFVTVPSHMQMIYGIRLCEMLIHRKA
ncbi:hypothetical protein AG1IA_04052 [Rhizoctonia solani AG-1 IA]|uniref:Uncharacterized protein n=1 Tax=Thanatephorus cucumeris (strain AG1-IA) TaxID=983506 RepID=L8WYN4_THACA|nr:hypothetical protein AG1IA_04052 [Rhizoctonia solani AG-1 IA]